MDKSIIDAMNNALNKANEELDKARYLEESGSNAGLRKINATKAEWLSWVIYLASYGFKQMCQDKELTVKQEDHNDRPICEQCPVPIELSKLIALKDDIVHRLQSDNDDLNDKLKSLQLTYDCEVEYRKALVERAMIDHFTQVIKVAHDHCWLDGTVLVTPVEYLDRALLELIKE